MLNNRRIFLKQLGGVAGFIAGSSFFNIEAAYSIAVFAWIENPV